MRKIYLILVLTTIFSCSSTKDETPGSQNIKIWEINSYIQDDVELINKDVKNVFFTYNTETHKSYITYLLSGDATYKLEKNWKKYNKKIRLDRVHIVQELQYKRIKNKVLITEVKKDFVLDGINTEEVRNKINKIIYAEREGESSGLIPLILNIWIPNAIEYIPHPELNKNDELFYKFDMDNIHLYTEDTSIELEFTGEHQWIGY